MNFEPPSLPFGHFQKLRLGPLTIGTKCGSIVITLTRLYQSKFRYNCTILTV